MKIEKICLNRKVKTILKKVELKTDCLVPDIKPDIVNIINTNGMSYLIKEQVENGKVKIVSPSNILSYVAVINRFGVLEGEYTRGGPGFSGEYSEFERKLDGSIPIAHYEETDGASYGISKDVVDYGNPADCMDQSRTLKENYELYTRLYPRLGQWYEYYFSRYKMNLDEVSDFLVRKQEDLECKSIEYEINKYLNQVCKDNHDTVELKCKLRRMVGFIKSVREKSPVGKKVADRILAKVSEELKKEREDEESKEEENIEQEKTLTKKEAVEKRLEKAKKRALNSHKKLKRYRRAVSTIEIELERIPLIGRSINRAAKRYEPKEDDEESDSKDATLMTEMESKGFLYPYICIPFLAVMHLSRSIFNLAFSISLSKIPRQYCPGILSLRFII